MVNVEPGQRWQSSGGGLTQPIKSVHHNKHKGCNMTGSFEPHVHYEDGDFDCLFHFGNYYSMPAVEQEQKPISSGSRAADYLRKIADRLIEKSKAYGDSIGDPVRIFSKSSKDEGIRVRIDDKLSRIAKGTGWTGDNDVGDLIGYLALFAVEQEEQK